MRTLHKFFFIFAGLFAVAVSIYIAVSPLTITSVTARSNGGGTLVEETTHQVSWYSVQGWWGIFILALFAALYAGNAYFGVTHRWKLLAIGTPIVLILTYLAGFSIGAYYLPAAIFTVLGGIVLLLKRTLQETNRPSN
jgi:hypothetical protein